MRLGAYVTGTIAAPDLIWSWGFNCDEGPKTDEMIQGITGKKWKYHVSRVPHDSTFSEEEDMMETRLKFMSDQMKLGVKAINKWYYTISTELKTQVLNAYGTNSNEVKAAFLAPLDWSTSVGMDYKLEKTKYKLSVFLAPLTHTMRFVGDRRVSETSYGLDEGAWVKHDFGSQVQTNFQWTIVPAVKLKTRLDYLTSYKWTRVEWETNVDFIFTKFLSARFYVLARYDDSAAPTVGDSYFQCTETLGFGLNYAW